MRDWKTGSPEKVERNVRVVALRKRGLRYREIGAIERISKQCARKIVKRAQARGEA